MLEKQQQVTRMLEEKTNALDNTITSLQENITNTRQKQLAKSEQLQGQLMKQQNFINILLNANGN